MPDDDSMQLHTAIGAFKIAVCALRTCTDALRYIAGNESGESQRVATRALNRLNEACPNLIELAELERYNQLDKDWDGLDA